MVSIRIIKKSTLEYNQTIDEVYNIYVKYQYAVHDRTESREIFEHVFITDPFINNNDDGISPTLGAYQQHYLLDGRIIAVGLIDMLPSRFISGYFFYDPDYSFLSLGTYSEKAIELAKKLEVQDFDASDHWLQNFKTRHSIKFCSEQGEAAAVNLQVVETWQQTVLREILAKYSADDVFNVDETGLFWRLMPNKTLAFKGDRCAGGKKSKERVTVLVGSNASGTEKLPLLVIGKSARPRCFNNARPPVEYAANKKAWMTGDLFERWLRKWDNRLRSTNRKILLFLDNFTGHPKVTLQNIELKFLPPNTTAASQPMDQGIIQNLKVHYRKHLIRRRIAAIDSGMDFTFNLLDSIFLLQRAWNAVTSTTISNCFRKAGFVFTESDEIQIDDVSDEDLASYWSILREHSEIPSDCELSDYLAVDNDVVTGNILTLEEIAQAASSSNVNEVVLDDDDDEDTEVTERLPISGPVARQAYLQLRQFCEENGLDSGLYSTFDQIEDFLLKDQFSKMKQPKISDFFAPR
uniref:DDE-1 domain-containing protein n=1 Tax=Acrobeloides nanus TaxID=290746 RepID=A0A914C297_9BILA